MPTSKSLVLVVGAGASKEANLPIGDELKHKIASVLDIQFEFGHRMVSGDHNIMQALQRFAILPDGRQGDPNPFFQTALLVRDAMPLAASIDNFIDAHRSNEKIALCGKLAIARCILEAEAHSLVQVDASNIYNSMNFGSLEATWYSLFFRVLVENCQLQHIPERLSRIAIVTFNYDRCIEHFLHAALRKYYDIDIQQARELLANLRIFHPYGSIGPLEWTAIPDTIGFGATPNAHQLLAIAKGLKTFTEGTDESHSEIVEIRSTIQSAERVAFLGFAFGAQNMNLLYGPSGRTVSMSNAGVYATALNFSESDAEVITRELQAMGGYNRTFVQINNKIKCRQLFEGYSRSLAIR